MLSGLIVYSPIDKEKNTWFIDKCIERFASKGVSLLYVDEDQVLNYTKDHQVDFVLYRARNYRLLEELENKGIRCFNNSLTNKTANDKSLTYKFLKSHQIECLSSSLLPEGIGQYPMIMKSVDGHGGQEVYLLNSKEDVKHYQKADKEYLYQKYYPNDGDLRLYVLNKRVIGSVLRHNSADYRSNFSLGGEVKVYQPEKEIVETALKIANLLKADYIGVDFLKVDNHWLVNEIEDPVGARMLYKTMGLDITNLLIDYIFSTLIH